MENPPGYFIGVCITKEFSFIRHNNVAFQSGRWIYRYPFSGIRRLPFQVNPVGINRGLDTVGAGPAHPGAATSSLIFINGQCQFRPCLGERRENPSSARTSTTPYPGHWGQVEEGPKVDGGGAAHVDTDVVKPSGNSFARLGPPGDTSSSILWVAAVVAAIVHR